METRASRFVTAGRSACALAAAVAALGLVPPAAGHAGLVETDPGNDSVSDPAPRSVTLRFNEPVESAFGTIRIYDSRARRVDDGRVARPDEQTLRVGIAWHLRRGTYTVAWRITSADAHPVSGTFVFHVEAPGAEPAGIVAEVREPGASRTVGVSRTAIRFVDFTLLLLVVGGAVALAGPLRSASLVRRRLLTALAVAAVLLGLAALAGIVIQGAAARGSGLGEAVSWDDVTAVLETRFGKLWLVQAALACAVAGLALAARRAPRRTWAPVLLVPVAALVPTPSLSGHASVSGNLSLLADLAHVAAASVWTGGLAFVVAALLVAGDQRWSLAADAVPRFSTLAVASVAVLLGAGVVSGYEEVGAWRGLWETTHGRLLLAKVVLVLPLLALGAYNNRCAVPRLRRGIASPVERRRFLRMAEAELAIVLAIVGVTSMLVAEPPAGARIAPDGPVEAAGPAGLAPGASAALRSPPTRGARKPADAWSLSCARFSKFVGPGASSVPAATHGSIQHLPEYPQVRLATPGQRRRALLLRSLLLAAADVGDWRDLRAAERAGYHTHTGRRRPGDRLVQYFHAERHQEPRTCGILNVRRPKALIYANAPGRPLVLVGAMWSTRVGERGPTPGGPITRWHYHVICSDEQRLPIDPTARGTCAPGQQLRRGRNEMLHLWFTRDLRSTFAIRAPEPELCAADLLPKGYCRARFLVSR